ncbi:MAG TPA: hypothetical protein VFN23_20005, partial [Ktedonobacteraceae bacterium]|nr:hypothetical protein [Ktedonobacteraceae bacterium]
LASQTRSVSELNRLPPPEDEGRALDTSKQLLQAAVQNNAIWCETICRSHNVPGEFYETCWVNRQRVPRYYPNLVTLAPLTDLQVQPNYLADLLLTRRDDTVSVKDSFSTLDLSAYGFQRLFQAQWIFREASTEHPQASTASLQWSRVATDQELLRWEAAWSQGETAAARLFLPGLLQNEDICILAGYQGGQLVAGAIANRTENVIGISNVFTPAQMAEGSWSGILKQIAARFPGLPLVGYEQDTNLITALNVGFTTLGPLQVWLK